MLPKGYPASVRPGYAWYMRGTMLSSVFGTAASVLSTQAMLVSAGVGAAAASAASVAGADGGSAAAATLPLAATLSWILKDGAGQLGGVLFAGAVNTRFDADPKRWRFAADLVLATAVVVESTTLLVPSLFLPVASAANVAKNVGWLSASATRASIHNAFAVEQNLGDVTAKAGSQTIAASLVGTVLGVVTTPFVAHHPAAVAMSVAAFSAGHLAASYFALCNVTLPTLSAPRAHLALEPVVEAWLKREAERAGGAGGAAAPADAELDFSLARTPRDVALVEPIFESWVAPRVPVRVGPGLDRLDVSAAVLETASRAAREDGSKYVVLPLPPAEGASKAAARGSGPTVRCAALVLVEAQPDDQLRAFLHASLVAALLRRGDRPVAGALEAARRGMARSAAGSLRDALHAKGWDVDHLFLEERGGGRVVLGGAPAPAAQDPAPRVDA